MTTKTKAMENNATVVGIVKDNELIMSLFQKHKLISTILLWII